MKPKNTKERRSSFIKFILLFVLVTATIMVTVFFNYRVPQKEIELLRERVKIAEQEVKFQEGFASEIKVIKNMLDSLDIPGQNVSFLGSQLNGKLSRMQESIPRKDSTYRYDMYTNVVKAFLKIKETKEELYSRKNDKKNIEECKIQLEKTEQKLKETERDLQILRITSNRRR
ncbi:hypothetical protein D1816_08655 [Aquimarina sp. AD10]|uniref:Type VI secretion system transmembrane protein TssO n=1 Tax=Aquimarina aggregata TaxID=1642818 RepID=A0A162Y5M4_9FLAO|nr:MULTISPECIES: type VI secretion system transmembrane protein TssO [Aquimarina]AXT60417.1 hypothetical protein D1816_08655 [Aquimarina sp. AD10]KZS38936.1 hypothetical protein AWE51_15250 [Aquimarina aggregata]RKN01148.1 hypothetical protein D7033_04830 [Aquimarina sp. AD10]